ncbi:MAG: EamA family transporter [Acidobacteria bacterium]|nr:EamA family transporter [Acidobacteriota bacterium]
MSYHKYLVLAGVTLCSAIGDSFLSRGMKLLGSVPPNHVSHILLAITHPWVAVGIAFLISFFACYASALSWADLTYVLPATSIGYVVLAVIAKYGLHEHITTARWIGIALISMGVGVVAGGPELTHHSPDSQPVEEELAALCVGGQR